MPKAVLRNGAIVPLEPLPTEWEEGAALEVERAATPTLDIAEWAQSMNQLCADSLAEEEEVMRSAIEDHRKQAKLQVRGEMGLPA